MQINWNWNFVGLLHHPLGLQLWHFWGITFQLFKLICLAKNHWWWFSNRMRIWSILINQSDLNYVYNWVDVSLYMYSISAMITVGRQWLTRWFACMIWRLMLSVDILIVEFLSDIYNASNKDCKHKLSY